MDKTFICLANSYKHGNRCIAGVEIVFHPENNTYVVKRDERGNPVWFRPINRFAKAGAIPNSEAQTISILDIVEARQVAHHPEGAQKENYYYDSLVIVSKIACSANDLDGFVDRTHRNLFGNKGVAVHPDDYGNLDYSVLMIKSSEIEFYMKDRTQWEKDPQPRGKIQFNGSEYDLPVTDPIFRQTIQNEPERVNSHTIYYIVLSLGVEHDEWHSKLIANVIPLGPEVQAFVPPRQQNTGNKMPPRKDSTRVSFNLFKQGFSIEQIAKQRQLSPSTICKHLELFIETGELDVRLLVSDDKIRRVLDYKRANPREDKLKPFYDAFSEQISYDEIRMVLTAYKNGYVLPPFILQ